MLDAEDVSLPNVAFAILDPLRSFGYSVANESLLSTANALEGSPSPKYTRAISFLARRATACAAFQVPQHSGTVGERCVTLVTAQSIGFVFVLTFGGRILFNG